jgi:hypothetical protein
VLLARQQRADRICTPGAGSRGVFEGGVYKGSEAPSTSGTFAPPLEIVCVMVERSLEVHSSLSSSAAMDSPHACTTPARSGPTHRAGRSMHGIHRGTMVGA